MDGPRRGVTHLFVPGDRPERFDRAASTGAEVVILDLEDGVEPAARSEARHHVVTWLSQGRRGIVRLNPRGTPDHELDVDALRGVAHHVMVAKAESALDADEPAGRIGDRVTATALIETAGGVLAASAIARSAVVTRLALGNVDLAAELGVADDDRQALLAARSMLVLASASAGLVGPVDGVTTTLDDPDLVRSDAAYASALGFRGKLCVHPRQVGSAREGFAPSAEQVAWALRVMSAASEGGGARSVGGQMVDRPVETRALDILRRQESLGPAQP